jgi:hypothetical protein
VKPSLVFCCLLLVRGDTPSQTPSRSAIEEVSADPKVLQVEMFPPEGDASEMGPNLMMGMIEDRLVFVAQLKPDSSTKTDFTVESAGLVTKIAVALIGESPPYKIVFERSISPVQPPRAAVSRQEVEFPLGRMTRVRLFDFVDVRGFYGNPQKKRP